METVLFVTLSNPSPSERREPPSQEIERVGNWGSRLEDTRRVRPSETTRQSS